MRVSKLSSVILFRAMRKAALLFLFFYLILFFSCVENAGPAENLRHFVFFDTTSVIKFTAAEQKIIAGLDSIFVCRVKETCFNGCVLVARKGKILYKKAMGFAEHEHQRLLDINSSFQLASASKTFTATAILMLMEKGKLNLDDDVKKFIPHFPYEGVTIKMLLCHRSGLPNYMYFAEKYFTDPDSPVSNADIVKCMITNVPDAYFPPGKKFEYCNTNYCLLSYLVERISGQPFPQFMKENIFDPLGMEHSWIPDGKNDSARSERTQGYMGTRWEPAEVNLLDGVN